MNEPMNKEMIIRAERIKMRERDENSRQGLLCEKKSTYPSSPIPLYPSEAIPSNLSLIC
jgi:hypothetical protein